MASKQDVVVVFNMVGAMFPWANMTGETLAVWSEILADVDAETLRAATIALLSEPSQYPPTAGTIRGRALDLAAGPESDWESGWQAVMAHMATCRSIEMQCTHDQLALFDPPTYAAVATIGWVTLCMTDTRDLPTVRAQFRDIYRTAAKRQRDAARTPPAVQAIMDAARPRIEPPAPPQIAALDAEPAQGIRAVPGDIGAILDAGGRPRRAELDAIIRRVAAQRGGVL